MASTLAQFSDQLASAVQAAARSIVAVHARPRQPSTGVHWRDGIIVTTNATVKQPDGMQVTLPNGSRHHATLVGRDPGTDLAVLRIPTGALAVAETTGASALAPGHMVLALAHAGEGGVQATFGIVSAVGDAWRTWRGGLIDRRVQSDLTLPPGFGGGPLVTVEGRIVGINSGGMSRPMAVTIPDTTVDRVVDQLLHTGYVARGYLGANMQLVKFSEAAQARLGLEQRGGLVVLDVEHESPAHHAGLEIGDVVVRMGDRRTTQHDDIVSLLGSEHVGTTMPLVVVRGGALVTLSITIGERAREHR